MTLFLLVYTVLFNIGFVVWAVSAFWNLRNHGFGINRVTRAKMVFAAIGFLGGAFILMMLLRDGALHDEILYYASNPVSSLLGQIFIWTFPDSGIGVFIEFIARVITGALAGWGFGQFLDLLSRSRAKR